MGWGERVERKVKGKDRVTLCWVCPELRPFFCTVSWLPLEMKADLDWSGALIWPLWNCRTTSDNFKQSCVNGMVYGSFQILYKNLCLLWDPLRTTFHHNL